MCQDDIDRGHAEALAQAERERALEREQMEIVFGLTGGELNDDSWQGYAYNYDGPPDYARDQFRDWHSADYRTVLHYGLFDGPPETIQDGETVYALVASFRSSGEAECLCNDVDPDELEGERCPVCENEYAEKGRRYVYVGEGWCEAVYRGSPLHAADARVGGVTEAA